MDDNRKTEKLLARLRVRGIDVSTDQDFMKIVPWTRFTFALCTIAAAVATAMASTLLLWAMVLIATLGAATTRHPFDYIYNKVVRRFTGTSELPENRAPTRFACGMAAVWFTCGAGVPRRLRRNRIHARGDVCWCRGAGQHHAFLHPQHNLSVSFW